MCHSQMTRVHPAEHILGVIITNEAWNTACSQNDLFCSCLILESSVKHLYEVYHFGHVPGHLILFQSSYIESTWLSVCHKWFMNIQGKFVCLNKIERSNMCCPSQDSVECHFIVLILSNGEIKHWGVHASYMYKKCGWKQSHTHTQSMFIVDRYSAFKCLRKWSYM